MAVVAAPDYLTRQGPDFYKTAPPGHRFTLYLRAWGENQQTGVIDWRTKDRVPKLNRATGLPIPGQFEDAPNDLFAYQIAGCGLPSQSYKDVARTNLPKTTDEAGMAAWRPMLKGLTDRQQAAASTCANILTLPAISVAPFATGLGIKHPLENGFAFLNPYGLPYLPGSSVKGVLRKAAQELADGLFGGSEGWTHEAIAALFGIEDSSGETHRRGALSFWDVIPEIKGDKLAVEIMTPHQSHYYQNGASPHDSGSPNPISFLAVPAGSGFTFNVQCHQAFLQRIAAELAQDDRWKTLLKAAFEHAFQWLGFGAKTAVGYGAMQRDVIAIAEAAEGRERAKQAEYRQTLSPAQLAVDDFIAYMKSRHESLRGSTVSANGSEHGKARALAKSALEATDWSADEKREAAGAIEDWLPKVVRLDMKDERKKLKLAQLRGPA